MAKSTDSDVFASRQPAGNVALDQHTLDIAHLAICLVVAVNNRFNSTSICSNTNRGVVGTSGYCRGSSYRESGWEACD
jgi:hypothetical protein